MEGKLKCSCIDKVFTKSEAKILDRNFNDHIGVTVRKKKAKVEQVKVSFQGDRTRIIPRRLFILQIC